MLTGFKKIQQYHKKLNRRPKKTTGRHKNGTGRQKSLQEKKIQQGTIQGKTVIYSFFSGLAILKISSF